MDMKIEQIEFFEDYFPIEFDESKQCWKGYIRFNYVYDFEFQVTKNKYTIFYETKKKNLSPWYKKDRKEIYEETQINDTVKKTFQDLTVFFEALEKVKQMKQMEIEENVVDDEREDCQERTIQLKSIPLIFEFVWDKFDEYSELSLRILPFMKDKKTSEKLAVHFMERYLGEEFIRNLWKEAIKEDKNRLRMMQFSIV
jgi:hypothetical protein